MLRKIAVIEDDGDTLVILDRFLTKAGYVINKMRDAVSLINDFSQLPDLFIIDKGIPTVDGLAVCKRLKLNTQTAQIPVIIISADHEAEDPSIAAGACAFIAKPFKQYKTIGGDTILFDVSIEFHSLTIALRIVT